MGAGNALGCIPGYVTIGFWSQFLRIPAKIAAVIEHLEELLCPSTAGVALVWTRAFGIVYAADRDLWKLVERKTLALYRAHGMGRLNTLSRRILDTTMKTARHDFLQYVVRISRVERERSITGSDHGSGTVV